MLKKPLPKIKSIKIREQIERLQNHLQHLICKPKSTRSGQSYDETKKNDEEEDDEGSGKGKGKGKSSKNIQGRHDKYDNDDQDSNGGFGGHGMGDIMNWK